MKAQIVGGLIVLINSVVIFYLEKRSDEKMSEQAEKIEQIRLDYEELRALSDSVQIQKDSELQILRIQRSADSVRVDQMKRSFNFKLRNYETQVRDFRSRLDDIGELPDF